MPYNPRTLSASLSLVLVALLLSACAPQQPAPKPAATQTPASEKPALMVVTATPNPQAAAKKIFDPKNPDWELRYQELYERFALKFMEPELGQSVEVELKNGNAKEGVLTSLTPTELSLDIGNGEITLSEAALSPQSATNFFVSAYARDRAVEQGRREYKRWQRMQEASKPKPSPTPFRTVRDIAGGGSGNAASTPGQNGVDVPDYNSSINRVPKNEGPTGRVAQVDEYIRKNAAVPHSLRVKAWGPVQQHGKGYKVRVQYTLEAADGFGTSSEDMMFFMHASGRVYRKAAVK